MGLSSVATNIERIIARGLELVAVAVGSSPARILGKLFVRDTGYNHQGAFLARAFSAPQFAPVENPLLRTRHRDTPAKYGRCWLYKAEIARLPFPWALHERVVVMAAKRPHSAIDSADPTQDADQRGPAKKMHKKSKHNKHSAGSDSIGGIKKRVRTIERRFQKGKDSIPQNVLQELERELSALHKRIVEIQDDKQRQVMIKKYHMVRFFG